MTLTEKLNYLETLKAKYATVNIASETRLSYDSAFNIEYAHNSTAIEGNQIFL
ncbi:hypothetical protein FACS1894188_09020 [Clostridia bacterium]|nr:hypothetical protein FACS1894188_09020 [Clostridia bacterium]